MIINNCAAEADGLSIILPLLGIVVGAGTLLGYIISLSSALG